MTFGCDIFWSQSEVNQAVIHILKGTQSTIGERILHVTVNLHLTSDSLDTDLLGADSEASIGHKIIRFQMDFYKCS